MIIFAVFFTPRAVGQIRMIVLLPADRCVSTQIKPRRAIRCEYHHDHKSKARVRCRAYFSAHKSVPTSTGLSHCALTQAKESFLVFEKRFAKPRRSYQTDKDISCIPTDFLREVPRKAQREAMAETLQDRSQKTA